MSTAADFNGSFDTLSLRLEQIDGMLAALMAIYTQQTIDKMHHVLCPLPMLNTLGGISEMVGQAKSARDTLSGCRFEPQKAKT